MKKPTGKTGFFRAEMKQDGQASGEFHGIDYPEDKDDIEEHIVSRFIRKRSVNTIIL
ncbi:MAG: hypothetical protein V3T17_00560 [Pseudomonadales bacterium]